MDSESITETALSLPLDQRLELTDRLLESLDAERARVVASSGDLATEVQRRSAEMDSGAVAGVSWDEVRDGIDQRLADGADA